MLNKFKSGLLKNSSFNHTDDKDAIEGLLGDDIIICLWETMGEPDDNLIVVSESEQKRAIYRFIIEQNSQLIELCASHTHIREPKTTRKGLVYASFDAFISNTYSETPLSKVELIHNIKVLKTFIAKLLPKDVISNHHNLSRFMSSDENDSNIENLTFFIPHRHHLSNNYKKLHRLPFKTSKLKVKKVTIDCSDVNVALARKLNPDWYISKDGKAAFPKFSIHPGVNVYVTTIGEDIEKLYNQFSKSSIPNHLFLPVRDFQMFSNYDCYLTLKKGRKSKVVRIES